MQTPVLSLLLLLAVATSALAANGDVDISHFGMQEDISPLLNNKDLVHAQINCVLHGARCDKLGLKLKKAIPEVITNQCHKCSPRQKANVEKLKNFLLQHYPGVWEAVVRKYGKRTAA